MAPPAKDQPWIRILTVRRKPRSATCRSRRADAESIAQLGSGQKLAIYAICTYIGTVLVRVLLTALFKSSLEDDDLFLIGLFAGAAFLVAFVLSVVGQWRMAERARHFHRTSRADGDPPVHSTREHSHSVDPELAHHPGVAAGRIPRRLLRRSGPAFLTCFLMKGAEQEDRAQHQK